MSHAAGEGRHRAAPQAGGRRTLLVPILGTLSVVLVVVTGTAWWTSRDTTSPRPGPVAVTPAPSTPMPSPGLVVDSEREVTLDGTAVEVVETSRLVEGETVRVTPPVAAPPGLALLETSVVAPDGRVTPLTDPVTLTAEGSVTVRGRYRLTACPDVLPTQWPSPADFPGASHTYSRLDEPQHTVLALCPREQSDAGRLVGLSADLTADGESEVRLRWDGATPLTVAVVGSASGVAVVVPLPECDATCVARVPAAGTAPLLLQTVDPCPPATTDDSLVLVVKEGSGPSRVVSVQVRGLHRVLCS